MSREDREQIGAALRQLPWARASNLDIRGNRVRVHVPITEFVGFADYLQSRFDCTPELIFAEDTREETGGFTLRYVFEAPGRNVFIIASVLVGRGQRLFPSLATRWYLASLFEREIHDLFGLIPSDHPDLRRLVLHQFWPDGYHPLLKDAPPPKSFEDDGRAFPFQQVQGEGLYQITVGPVHAGIIEPGHFRFSVDGETIVNLESRLFFLQRNRKTL